MEGEFEDSYIDKVYDKDDQVIKATQVDVLQLKDNNIPRVLVHLEELFDQYDQVIEANQVNVLQLKYNNIPRGRVPLEDLFNQDDVARNPTMGPTEKGVLLNYLVENEAKEVITDFHKGDYGGHLFWKTMTNKVLRAGYYWPIIFQL